ncbi:MAG: phosphoribosylanthranilate isomerase [Acidobacteria bacterium]|nr:phosphoribosylanthranilate isomerase [Acidobacteriota bacterium]
MKPRVKICGITNIEDALFCARHSADALGFIFYEKSPRGITPAEATKIIQKLPVSVLPIGVFVNEPRAIINRIIDKTRIRIIQLSGDETTEDCSRYDVKVWKAFRFTNLAEVEDICRYTTISAALLDGGSGKVYGGSGALADFKVARKMKSYHPLVLAGGLNPDNVVEAINAVGPSWIDVNSGVESSPGKKDHEKIKLLFERLHETVLST